MKKEEIQDRLTQKRKKKPEKCKRRGGIRNIRKKKKKLKMQKGERNVRASTWMKLERERKGVGE